MDDVRGDFLRPPHGTTPAAVIENQQFGFRPGPTQTGLYSHRSRLEA